jgi:hypothetical protein
MPRRLNRQLLIRVSDADIERLEVLTGRLPFKRAKVARLCMRLGIATAQDDLKKLFHRKQR